MKNLVKKIALPGAILAFAMALFGGAAYADDEWRYWDHVKGDYIAKTTNYITNLSNKISDLKRDLRLETNGNQQNKQAKETAEREREQFKQAKETAEREREQFKQAKETAEREREQFKQAKEAAEGASEQNKQAKETAEQKVNTLNNTIGDLNNTINSLNQQILALDERIKTYDAREDKGTKHNLEMVNAERELKDLHDHAQRAVNTANEPY